MAGIKIEYRVKVANKVSDWKNGLLWDIKGIQDRLLFILFDEKGNLDWHYEEYIDIRRRIE